MARIRKNPDLRRQEILDVSLKLFVEKGFQNVVIDDIALTVGIARTTFYEYYTNKEQILVELVDRVADEVRESIPHGKDCQDKFYTGKSKGIRRVILMPLFIYRSKIKCISSDSYKCGVSASKESVIP